jgi:purine-cytosine permease-like protein
MGFWSVVLFAWFCNSAMHLGMSDLSIFRYAKKASYGWATAGGMYVGHYMAWIAAAFMLAAQIKVAQNAVPLPGPMAYHVTGVAGIICVIIAGWTTANPTIYRAGLAFQGIFPRSSRLSMTLLAGAVATVAAVFPALAFKLLGFVGLYGTILAPVGGIIFADWYLARAAGVDKFPAARTGEKYNLAVLFAWLLPVGVALWLITVHVIAPVAVAVKAVPQDPALQAQAVPAALPAGALALAPHVWHAVMVLNLYVLTAQLGQEVVPSSVDNVPAAQFSQLSAAEAVQVVRYLPVPHSWRGGSVNSKCRSGVRAR